MPEDAKGAASALPLDFQLRFNFRFENLQMFVDAARGHAAQFSVDQSEVGKNGQRQSDEDNT